MIFGFNLSIKFPNFPGEVDRSIGNEFANNSGPEWTDAKKQYFDKSITLQKYEPTKPVDPVTNIVSLSMPT